MKKLISITTAGEFVGALEDWIIKEKCNPKTPEEWSKCTEDMIKSGVLKPIAVFDEKNTPEIKAQLKENLNVRNLNDNSPMA